MRNMRKVSKRPRRPWEKEMIAKERKILNEYGLRRKRELRRAEAIVREFRRRARDLIAVKDAAKNKILMDKVIKLGLLQQGAGLSDILALDATNVLNRRLQTIISKKGHANSIRHARQMITHGHVYVEGRRMFFPSYLVPVEKESRIEVKGADKSENGK